MNHDIVQEARLAQLLLESNAWETGTKSPHKFTGREARRLAAWLVQRNVLVAEGGKVLVGVRRDATWAGGWVLRLLGESVAIETFAETPTEGGSS